MLQLLIAIVAVGMIFNRISKKYTLERIHYRRSVERRILEIGEEFVMESVIENRKVLPVSFLQIKHRFSRFFHFTQKADLYEGRFGKVHTMTMILLPYQRVTRKYRLQCEKRGRHFFSETSLVSGDFIGLQTVTRILENDGLEIVVLPKPVNLNESIEPVGSYYGDLSVNRWIIEDPIVNRGLREYTGSEPEKHIHWPSSLKTGELLVKNFDYTTDRNAVIVFNTETTRYLWEKRDKDAVELYYSVARGIAEELEEEGIPFGMASNVSSIKQFFGNTQSEIGYGPRHLSMILESLGRGEDFSTISFKGLLEEVAKVPDRSRTYILITPIVFEEDVDAINQLATHAGKVIILCGEKGLFHKLSPVIEKYCLKPRQ